MPVDLKKRVLDYCDMIKEKRANKSQINNHFTRVRQIEEDMKNDFQFQRRVEEKTAKRLKKILGQEEKFEHNEELSYDDTEERKEDAKLFGRLYDDAPLKTKLK